MAIDAQTAKQMIERTLQSLNGTGVQIATMTDVRAAYERARAAKTSKTLDGLMTDMSIADLAVIAQVIAEPAVPATASVTASPAVAAPPTPAPKADLNPFKRKSKR